VDGKTELAQLIFASAQFRCKSFTSQADYLAHFVNEPSENHTVSFIFQIALALKVVLSSLKSVRVMYKSYSMLFKAQQLRLFPEPYNIVYFLERISGSKEPTEIGRIGKVRPGRCKARAVGRGRCRASSPHPTCTHLHNTETYIFGIQI
jgi:hypothetical protein